MFDNIHVYMYRPLRATYADGVSTPRGGLSSSSLPSPRKVSAELHHETPDPNNINTEVGL